MGFFVGLFFLPKGYNRTMKKSHTKYIRLFMALLVVVGLYFLFLSTSESISYPETSFHDGKTYLDPVGKNEAEKNLAETQKLYDSYNASTSVYTRVGTLMRLYGYQESL